MQEIVGLCLKRIAIPQYLLVLLSFLQLLGDLGIDLLDHFLLLYLEFDVLLLVLA